MPNLHPALLTHRRPLVASPRLRLALVAAAMAAPFLFAGGAQAAVTLVVQRGPSGADTSTISIDKDKMRVEDAGKGEVFIIDAAGKRMLIIRDKEKTWSEITEADMKRFSDLLTARRAAMQDRLKSMPPEQRQRTEQMMGGLESAKPRPLKFEKMGEKKTVNGFSCEMYRVLEEGGPAKEEDCITPWSASVVQKSDFSGLRKFANDMAKTTSGLGAENGREMVARLDKYPGFPVTRHPLEPGLKEDEQLKSAKRGAAPASAFSVPAGYAKMELQPRSIGGPTQGTFKPLPPPHHP